MTENTDSTPTTDVPPRRTTEPSADHPAGPAPTADSIAALYRFCSAVFADPPTAEELERLSGAAGIASETAPNDRLEAGLERLDRWLEAIDDPEATATTIEREHTRLFVGPRPTLLAHESYYADDYLGEPLARVTRQYATLGVAPGPNLREEVDYVAVELAALSLLAERDERSQSAAFLEDHGWWLPAFAADLREATDHRLYRAVADVLEGLVRFDAARHGAELSEAYPGTDEFA